MSELRKDPILGQWVIVHTDESWSPDQYEKEDNSLRHQETCQFCPGKEHFTPPEVFVVRLNGTQPNSPDWKVRVVSNKFPALKIEGEIDPRIDGILEMANGIGAHEVLIETADHNKSLADLSQEEVVDVIDGYKARLNDLTKDTRFKYIVIFKNFGESAGTTVEHAHSQIIALPMIPKYVRQELIGMEKYTAEKGGCIYCDIISQEKEDTQRIVAENESFLAFCPFVPRYAFECWILPKNHQSDFATLDDNDKKHLAQILKDVLSRMKTCLTNPSYNYYFHISPVNSEQPKGFHWHIEIVPKLTKTTGFEWGTGFYVVQTAPALAARYLRQAKD